MASHAPHPETAQPSSAHLFTLRVWQERVGESRLEWRGKLHHIASDDVTYFREWAALVPVLLAMLRHAGATISVEQVPDWVEEEETLS